ncbi:hypothetical protein H6795_04585 [Candidatus Nomurabacteria bacterium]|nr:hypothetical protein [Candidatus Nomurabacteria bacterium]
MTDIVESPRKKANEIAKELVCVTDDSIEVLKQAFYAGDQRLIDDYFYTVCAHVSEYLNSLPQDRRVQSAFRLMHDQIDALGDVEKDSDRRAATRLNADALLQACLLPLPPYAPWELIDLMGHAAMRTSDVANDVLLPILAGKRVVPELSADAPLGVHLLRIRSVGVIGVYQQEFWPQMKQILERYQRIDIPLLAMTAQIESDNCELEFEMRSNDTGHSDLTQKSADLLKRQSGYEDRFCDVLLPDGFDSYKQYVRIAPDAIAAYSAGGNVERFVRIKPGLPTDQSEIHEEEILEEVSAYDETEYPLLYDRYTLGAIGDRLGLDVLRITLTTQQRLFDFMIESDNQRFKRVETVLQTLSSEDRLIFAEAFLATEYGESLGDSILQIAERSESSERGNEIFRLISSIRENARVWESNAWFAQPDCEYNEYFAGIKQAIESRISQILSPTPDLMDGITQLAQYFHRDDTPAERFDIDSVEQVVQGLKILNLLIQKLSAAEAEPISDRKSFVEEDYMSSSASSDGSTARIMMRPTETPQAEARIRWAVNITPQEQMEIFGRYLDVNSNGQPRNAKASLRLDFEKISGRLSLDLGSSMQYGSGSREYPDVLLAALITAGVQHDALRQGKDIAHLDYHVRDTFDLSLSNPDTFAGFVRAMQERYVDKAKIELGRMSVEATGLTAETTKESLPNVVYTGVFFDDAVLRSVAGVIFSEPYEHIPDNPHITLKFRPKDGGLKGLDIGKQQKVRVVGYINDGKAQVLIIDQAGFGSDVTQPHITIATGNDANGKKIPPMYSKYAIKQAEINGSIVWFDKPIELVGTIGYFDAKAGKVITQPK